MPLKPDTVNVKQLRDNLAAYLDLAQRGHEVIVTNHGRAVAKIAPIARTPRVPGALKGRIGPQPADAWDLPEDVADLMEGRNEE